MGNIASEHEAIYLAQRLASLIDASAVLLQAPALLGSAEACRILMRDPSLREALGLFGKLDLALVGIGSMEPSRLLSNSGNVFTPEERKQLSRQGAVGDICNRFFDANGIPVKSPLMQRVIGIELPTLRRAGRVVGVAGGRGRDRRHSRSSSWTLD